MKINKDHILALVEETPGKLVKRQFAIKSQYPEILKEVRAVSDRADSTVVDLSEKLQTLNFPSELVDEWFWLCNGHSYSGAYIDEAHHYPELFNQEKLEKDLQEIKDDTCKRLMRIHNVEHLNQLSQKDLEDITAQVTAAVLGRKKYLKHTFFKELKNFLWALGYKKCIEYISAMPEAKMWSLDTCGWEAQNYPISENMRIRMNTNFGYGSSSYMDLCLTYKGVEILPYSHIIQYRYAKVMDTNQYLRSYFPDCENWEDALDFAMFLNNMGEESFENDWLPSELRKLVEGLERVICQPKVQYAIYESMKGEKSPYINFRNLSDYEVEGYNVRPEEILLEMQIEKTIHCMKLANNLFALSEIYSPASDIIDRLNNLASQGVSQFDEHVVKIREDLKRIAKEETAIREIISSLEKDLAPFERELARLVEEGTVNVSNGYRGNVEWRIKEDYEKTHPDYSKLKKEHLAKGLELMEKTKEYNRRNNFLQRVLEGITSIKNDIEYINKRVY